MVVAVTADIVGSRQAEDRAEVQRVLDSTIERVGKDLPVWTVPLRPTVGDEQQGVCPDLPSALGAVLLLQLALPDDVECRFGLGVGEIADVASREGTVSEGPAWWAARAAIEHVHKLARRTVPRARTWVDVAEGESVPALALVNAGLLARDEVVGAMSERTRRLTYGRCLGRMQKEIAADEGITQPAVSQALANAGSLGVIEGFRLLGIRRTAG